MTPAQINKERQTAMTAEELKARQKRIDAAYSWAIQVREGFEELCADAELDEEAAATRLSELIFGDGTGDGSDAEMVP